MRDLTAEKKVRDFYDSAGWKIGEQGKSVDAEFWEDLRECAKDYVSACRLKVLEHLPKSGEGLLGAGSGSIQYEEYLEYSKNFSKRVCVDISRVLQIERLFPAMMVRLGAYPVVVLRKKWP